MSGWSRWAVLLVVAAVASGCGKKTTEEPTEQCSAPTDCSSDEKCEDGACVALAEGECNDFTHCPGGHDCVDKVCVQIPVVEDVGTEVPEDIGQPEDDANYDNIPPQLLSVTPEDQAVDVAIDTTLVMVFDEALRPPTVNFQSIELRNPANDVVPADLVYDDATFTVTMTPQEPLLPATPYRLTVTTFVRDASDNALLEATEVKFYTAYEEPAGVRAIAEKYAPHIYQGIDDTDGAASNVDIPTRIDFDGNLKARDNRANALEGALRNSAAVYYNVTESKTHYFAMYAMYYPARKDAQNLDEHDFAGAVLVIDKATEEIVLVDGVKVQTGTDTSLSFRPSGGAITATNAPNLRDFDPATLEDETHLPMFVPGGIHETCIFPVAGSPPRCLHNAGQFPGEGVLLKPGAAQNFNEAVDTVDPLYGEGYKEMTYELVPLAETLWVRRSDVGSEHLWQGTQPYAPSGEDRPDVASDGSAIVLPTLAYSDDETTYGKPPFQWLRTSTTADGGQWLIDPTYHISTRYDVGEEWSQDYCYNIFLNTNLRGDSAAPECEAD